MYVVFFNLCLHKLYWLTFQNWLLDTTFVLSRLEWKKPFSRRSRKLKHPNSAKQRWNYNWNCCVVNCCVMKPNWTCWLCTPSGCLVTKDDCIEGKAPDTRRKTGWWLIDALSRSAARCLGALVKIDDIMNSTKCHDIIAQNAVASARRLGLGCKIGFSTRQWAQTSDASSDPQNSISVSARKPYLKPVVFEDHTCM